MDDLAIRARGFERVDSSSGRRWGGEVVDERYELELGGASSVDPWRASQRA